MLFLQLHLTGYCVTNITGLPVFDASFSTSGSNLFAYKYIFIYLVVDFLDLKSFPGVTPSFLITKRNFITPKWMFL